MDDTVRPSSDLQRLNRKLFLTKAIIIYDTTFYCRRPPTAVPRRGSRSFGTAEAVASDTLRGLCPKCSTECPARGISLGFCDTYGFV
jgi:hypothetical protein